MDAVRLDLVDDGTADALTRARLDLRDLILKLLGDQDELATCVDGLTVIQRTTPVPPTSFVYRPSLAMIMQGRKNIDLAGQGYFYDEANFMLTAVDLPTITEVTEASPERPYVSILLELDLELAKELTTRVDMEGRTAPPASGLAIGAVDLPMIDAMARLVALARTPDDARFLAAPIKHELLYRVLIHPVGRQLREIIKAYSKSHRVARAITWLRENYKERLQVGELASLCAMGVSTLHLHFRTMTGTSPLQYQKHLRLHEARRLLVNGEADVGMAAISVGYESATQFNREYKRLFGAPPRRETQRLRTGAVTGASHPGA
jgi:AraC-like DNA-binding protein